MISWFSRKKTNIALSTVEVEYIAACSACSEAIWLRNMLAVLFDAKIDVTDILCDNQSCMKMTLNLVLYDKTKHIEGCVQEVEGLFWHVRCNTKLKK